MDDLISRQEAIDVAVNYHCDHDITIIPNTRWTDGFKTGWNLRENDIVHGLEELPPAQPDTPMRGSKVAETVGNGTDRTTGDCISRRAAINELMETVEEHKWDQFGGALLHWTGVKAILTGLPSAQPERKTGRWIYCENDVDMRDGYRCDKCGFFVPWDYQHKAIDFIKDYHYCPDCGSYNGGGDDNKE